MLKRQQSLSRGTSFWEVLWYGGGCRSSGGGEAVKETCWGGVRAANPSILMILCSSECPGGVDQQKLSILILRHACTWLPR